MEIMSLTILDEEYVSPLQNWDVRLVLVVRRENWNEIQENAFSIRYFFLLQIGKSSRTPYSNWGPKKSGKSDLFKHASVDKVIDWAYCSTIIGWHGPVLTMWEDVDRQRR